MSADPEHEEVVLFPLENGFAKKQESEEDEQPFLAVEAWDWELYTIKSKGSKLSMDKMDHRKCERTLVNIDAIGTKQTVFLRGQVKSKTGKVQTVRSAPLKFWSTQRVNSEYRIWLQSKEYLGFNLWYMVSFRCSKAYEKIWEPLRKVLQSFKPLLDAIGRGPPLTEEVDWLWRKTMKWNDVDAEVIMEHVESLQPSARQILEEQPEFVLTNFFETLPECGYAGVRRGSCDPAWYTLEEYFMEGKKKGKYPRKERVLSPRKAAAVAAAAVSMEDGEIEFEDSSKAAMLPPIKCRICGGFTRSYEKDSDAGIQHFVIFNGKKEELDNVPMCDFGDPKKLKKGAHKRSRKEEKQLPQHGYKKKTVALSHSFGQVGCPGCKRSFNLPDQAAQMEQHICKHHLKEPLYASVSGNVSNALRVRIVIEDLFPPHLME